jgi:hypothetical protein
MQKITIYPSSEFLNRDEGFFKFVPMDTYQSLKVASAHKLGDIADHSPKYMKYREDHPEDPSPTFIVGTHAHSACLEVEEFSKLKLIDASRRTKAYAEARESFGDYNIITMDDREMCLAMSAAFHAHPIASELVEGAYTELSARFTIEGVASRLRADIVNVGHGILADYKTCQSAHPEKFSRDAYKYGYFRQLAFYKAGVQALGIPIHEVWIIAQEKEPPYELICYEVDASDLAMGENQIYPLLEQYKEARESGEYPGYPQHRHLLSAPAWAWRD